MVQNIITWIEENCEWLFDGAGTEIIILIGTGVVGIIGLLIKKMFKFSENGSENKSVDNSIFCTEISGDQNITGNNNTINIYQSQEKEDREQKENSLFSTRFKILQNLLNDARCYNEKEYTIEYISSLVGIKNAGEMRKYVEGNKEPDEEIKQRFVDVFGVNRDWMLFNQGDYPFASNLKRYTNGEIVFDNKPMDILLNEKLWTIKEFILILGRYEDRRSVLIIRKSLNGCYDLYPKVYDLDSNVGGSGRSRLVSFYRFLKEADKIGKISSMVYEATEEQFRDLYLGAVAPMVVRKYKVFVGFTDGFIDLSEAEFKRNELLWDKNLVKVKRIIQCDIENVEHINRAYDLEIIKSNMKKEEETRGEQVILNASEDQVNSTKDNGCIVGQQNSKLMQDDQREKMYDEWMHIINMWCEYIDIDNWEEWTFCLLDAGLPKLWVENVEMLEKFREWMFKKVWPEGYDDIREALDNFYRVVNDFLDLFHKHSEQRGQTYYTKRFYHIDEWEMYDKLLLEFKNHVRLLDDMVLELTRAGNYVCDMVRKYLNPEFRLKEGKLIVKSGPDDNMKYDILRPEYREEELNGRMLYRGIEQFKEDRCKRDCFWGEEK